jgi:hypothetical protein
MHGPDWSVARWRRDADQVRRIDTIHSWCANGVLGSQSARSRTLPTVPQGSKWVTLEFPEKFRLGIQALARECGWRTRLGAGGAVSVCLEERYSATSARLVAAQRLTDANAPELPEAYAAIEHWARSETFQVDAAEVLADIQFPDYIANPKVTGEIWSSFRLRMMIAAPADLPAIAREAFSWVAGQAPGASLWLVKFDPKVSWRFSAVRALFSAEQAPEVLDRPPEQFRGFAPGTGLGRSMMFGFSSYTDSLLMTASPWLIGMSAPRRSGSLMILFGEARPGWGGEVSANILDLLRPPGVGKTGLSVARPDVGPANIEAALTHWVSRLNVLFGLATDVANFVDGQGRYLVAEHLGALLSLERLFASVQGLLAHARNEGDVRLSLAFSLLDQLQGLGFDTWPSMLSASEAAIKLGKLEEQIPGPARDLMLTRCQPAVAALVALTNGIDLAERVEDGQIRLRTKAGAWEQFSLEEATWRYLRLIRNANHSFTELMRDPRDVSIMVAHKGEIADELADLGLLHALRYLHDPVVPRKAN